VQTVWLCLALLTVFMGSMLAYREKVMKKRLAYSTVSQASYILFGLALLQPQGMIGALLHVVFHAVIKSCLFLSAGAIIYKTHKTRVAELRGIGKEMPVAIWCYTFASAALIGIPPASGFISKWYLATGALASGVGVFSWLGPVVLLTSALLTAGYLLPITVNGFLPGADFDYGNLKKKEPNLTMLLPLLILAALAVALGVFPNPLTEFIAALVNTVL
jgi:multicomponent Na+:H+ antiporter subunit D